MSSDVHCRRVRELAPELALEIADGADRASVLKHLEHCAKCRRHLEELSLTADELLTLVPGDEPPLGFETRVVTAMQPELPQARRRGRLALAVAAAAAVAAAITAVAMAAIYDDDRELASEYRSVLSKGGGSYFTAGPISNASGDEVGQVFGYEGDSPWVFIVLDASVAAIPDGHYRCRMISAGGATVGSGYLDVKDGQGSWGGFLDVAVDDVDEIRMRGPRGVILTGRLQAR